MRSIKLRAPGKINLTLDVKYKRPDGYHEVETLMQSISLWDKVVLTECNEGIHIISDSRDMPLNETNLAGKAARLIIDRFSISSGITIEIEKNIPIAAGLAGGSTNAAAVLLGLNALWNLGLSQAGLMELGARLGADVPFCICGGTAVARGIGEKITQLFPLIGIWIVLVKPPFKLSAASIYQELDLTSAVSSPDWKNTYRTLRDGQFGDLHRYMGNHLEQAAVSRHLEIDEIKRALTGAGAAVSMMTGSGPAVYGIFTTKEEAEEAGRQLKSLYEQVYVVSTNHRGAEIIEGGSR